MCVIVHAKLAHRRFESNPEERWGRATVLPRPSLLRDEKVWWSSAVVHKRVSSEWQPWHGR